MMPFLPLLDSNKASLRKQVIIKHGDYTRGLMTL